MRPAGANEAACPADPAQIYALMPTPEAAGPLISLRAAVELVEPLGASARAGLLQRIWAFGLGRAEREPAFAVADANARQLMAALVWLAVFDGAARPEQGGLH